VFGVIKQSDGYVDVWSEEGRGTRFTIYLPRVARPVDDIESVPGRDVAARGRETLLLVEDETSVRKLTRRALEGFGYEVLEAASGDEALALARARAGRIALLITDVVMPGMSGAQLAERLAPEFPTLKVLFVSGYIDDAIVRHGVVAGAHSFLQKPFMPAVLAAKVREILDRR
jgi:CheY-like chemotaxis protein